MNDLYLSIYRYRYEYSVMVAATCCVNERVNERVHVRDCPRGQVLATFSAFMALG